MNVTNNIISALESTPEILSDLLKQIPVGLLKVRRIPNKWSIYEHATHLVTVDKTIFLNRWRQFKEQPRPVFVPSSGESFPPDHFMKLDLDIVMNEFREARAELVREAHNAPESFLELEADHPEYLRYTPFIMLRHLLMHDHLHMYRIEELWLTHDEYLKR